MDLIFFFIKFHLKLLVTCLVMVFVLEQDDSVWHLCFSPRNKFATELKWVLTYPSSCT